MPELPEAETVRRVMQAQICGRTVTGADLRRPEIAAWPAGDPDAFADGLLGRTFDRVERRGKFLRFVFTDGARLVLHLRMTGCLLAVPADWPEERHTHLVLTLDSGMQIRYEDPRRFGRFWLLNPWEEDTVSGIGKLGLEPWDPALTGEWLQKKAAGRRIPVKEFLLDQSAAAGIGNIYADEILFEACLHPARSVRDLTGAEWDRLAALIPQVLEYFIEKDAVTPGEYLESGGREYRNGPFLKAYGRAGKPCLRCGAVLQRTVIGGRSAVFCPACQK